jgi:hypothetical protein
MKNFPFKEMFSNLQNNNKKTSRYVVAITVISWSKE